MSAGHETTFCALLYCLAALGVLRQADLQALVTRVFAKYLDLMRKVQTTYWSASLRLSLITRLYDSGHCLRPAVLRARLDPAGLHDVPHVLNRKAQALRLNRQLD